MIRWTLLLVGAFLLVSGVSARFDFADAVAPGAPVSLSSALRMRDEGKRRWVSLDVPVDRDHAVYRTGLTRPAFSRAPSSAITPVLDVRNEDELAGFVGSRVEVRLAKAREALVLRASRSGTKAPAVHLLVRLAISSPSLWALSPRLPERDEHAQREWSRRDGATGRLSRFRDLTANVRDLEHDPESIRQALRREWGRDVPPDAWVIIADDPASAPQRSMAGEAWLPLRGSANGLFFVDPAGGRLAGSTRIEGVLRSLPAASVPGLEEAIGIPLPPIIGVVSPKTFEEWAADRLRPAHRLIAFGGGLIAGAAILFVWWARRRRRERLEIRDEVARGLEARARGALIRPLRADQDDERDASAISGRDPAESVW